MAKQRFINTHFWDDSYIVTLDPIEKLLFLYLLTNPLTNIAGAYEISLRRMEFDTGIERDTIHRIFTRFAASGRIEYREGWILIVNFIKNQSINPKIFKGIEDAVSDCPDWIKDRLSREYKRLSHLNRDVNRDTNRDSNEKGGTPDGDRSQRQGEDKPEAAKMIEGTKNLTNKEFLDSLVPLYPGINVQQVFNKMTAWCSVNGKQPTRRRLVNWLNREDVPISPGKKIQVGKQPEQPADCPKCKGTGELTEGDETFPCPKCNKVNYEAYLDLQEMKEAA